jgi:hypothetical protein
MHVHAQKGETECKFWVLADEVEIRVVFAITLDNETQFALIT